MVCANANALFAGLFAAPFDEFCGDAVSLRIDATKQSQLVIAQLSVFAELAILIHVRIAAYLCFREYFMFGMCAC